MELFSTRRPMLSRDGDILSDDSETDEELLATNPVRRAIDRPLSPGDRALPAARSPGPDAEPAAAELEAGAGRLCGGGPVYRNISSRRACALSLRHLARDRDSHPADDGDDAGPDFCFMCQVKCTTASGEQHTEAQRLRDMIDEGLGRVPQDELWAAVMRHYDAHVRPDIEGMPAWPVARIRDHVHHHEVNPHWNAWINAADLRMMIRANINNGVFQVESDDDGNPCPPSVNLKKAELHLKLMRALEKELAATR